MSDRPSSRDRYDDRRPRRRGNALFSLFFFLVFAFILLSMIGLFGEPLRDIFAGIFGFTGYIYFSLILLSMILRAFGFRRRRMKLRTFAYLVVLSFILLLLAHFLTSLSAKVYEEGIGYGTYVNACFDGGLKTSGGVVLAWIAYPLLSFGKFMAIPLAVLFFVVLFFALLPRMRVEKRAPVERSRSKPPVKKEKAPEKPKKAPRPVEEKKKPAALRLFVDKVRPGQKDAQKIKRAGFFGKKKEEPVFFDYRDNTPLYSPDGVIPEARPERYDVHATARPVVGSQQFGAEDWEDYPARSSSDVRYADPVRSTDFNYADERGDDENLPPFVRRYASERAEANRRLYGEENFSETLPEEPKYDRGEEPVLPEQEAPQPSRADIPVPPSIARPKARMDDLIQDMDDLHRIRDREDAAGKREPFIGERITPSALAKDEKEDLPLPEEPKPVFDTPKPSFEEKEAFIEPMKENREESVPAPVEKKAQPEDPFINNTITPRESSFLTPKEEPRKSEPVRSPEPVAPTSIKPDFEEEEPVLRTRKPRSDLGGTHRSPTASKPMEGFIPPKKAEQIDIAQALKEAEEAPARPYTPPPVNLLKDIPSVTDESDVEERAEGLVQALASFNIESEVIDHKTGPTFTRFAVTLPDNMSVNKLTPLEKDIKRKLKVDKNIRIIPSVPGLDAVGVEVPNKKTSMVGLRSIISAPEFAKEGKLYFAIGVDVSGKAVYGDLLKMPHLLVAGSTGSGKSVCLNVMICSIMYHYSPEVVRFIMVDPKKVELSVYKNMPHMLMPSTVTESDKAINALNWAVNEMERRYLLLMENGCRNIGEYNAKQAKTGGKKLYYIVIIVDEMADLMYAAKREVEEKVNRITAKARAAGIHLVVATQRPSVDVITGTIKNNIPTRIAFKVTSFTDSKTILDKAGAEALFGNGDMLYMPPDGGEPLRLQGPYINNEEIEEVVSFVKSHNDTRFDGDAERIIQAEKEDPMANKGAEEGAEEDDGEDEYFADALLYFIKIGQASISKLQIKYHIGYGRAARIVETMSERGYLGPTEPGNKSRAVNITLDQYYELYGEDGIDGAEV